MEQIKNPEEYWSVTEGIFNCLIDEDRSLAFERAIKNTVKNGDIVVDMGTGSGVLAMFAADAGAQKVYAVESNQKNIKTLQKTFEENNYKDKIILIEGDVTKIDLPEKVDVIIGELIATGLVEESQIPATNNMLRFGKPNVKVLLKKYESYIDLVNNNLFYYNHKFPIVRYEYPDLKKLKSQEFSDKFLYASVDFSKTNTENTVNIKKPIKIKKSGLINGIRISSKTIFFDDSTLWASFAYSYPIILPIKKTRVSAGEEYIVSLNYIMCEGFNKLKYFILKK